MPANEAQHQQTTAPGPGHENRTMDVERHRRRVTGFLELLRQANGRVRPPIVWYVQPCLRSACIRGDHVEFTSKFSPLTLPSYCRDGIFVPADQGIVAINSFGYTDISEHLLDAVEVWPASPLGCEIQRVLKIGV